MTQSPDPNDKLPVWIPAAHAAAPLGLSTDLLMSAIDEGQLPIKAASFGRRGLRFVSSADVAAYVRSLHPAQGISA